MYYIAHQMLPDRQQCEDVIQESLTNLIAKVDILKTLTKPKLTNYIVVTVRHTAINASCRQNREKRYTEPLSETSEDFLPTSPSSIDILLRNERIEDLRKAMKVLRPDEQRLLEGKYFLGYDDGVVWFEPTVKTIVSSSKTMAQVTVSMECRYNDTGYLMTSDGKSSGKGSENNVNTVSINSSIPVYNTGSQIAVFSSHGATYSKSDVLYMTTLL